MAMIKKEIEVQKAKKILEVVVDNGFSYSFAQKLLRNKDIKLNGRTCKENVKTEVGDVVTCYYKEEVRKLLMQRRKRKYMRNYLVKRRGNNLFVKFGLYFMIIRQNMVIYRIQF